MQVYAISDVHFDHKCNEECKATQEALGKEQDWAHRIDDFQFQEAKELAEAPTAARTSS